MFGWFKEKKVGIDISSAIEDSFERIQEKSLIKVNELKVEIESLRKTISEKNEFIKTQGERLRAENEADLLFLCEKIKKELLEGKEEKQLGADLEKLNYLRNQLQMLNANWSRNFTSGLGNIFGHY